MFKTILTSLDNNILTITINRPDKLNVLNREVMDELDKVINEVEGDDSIKGAILTGSGQKGFVAGADISEFVGRSASEGKELSRKGHEIFFRIERCTKPVIAAVNGFALGGGCELAMACHFRVASENAKFGQPEVNLGLIPGYGGTQRLVQLIGKGRALELLMTGNIIDANTALSYGLVNYVVPQEQLLTKTTELVQIIINKAPVAITQCIRAVNAVFNEKENGFDIEIEAFGDCFATNDMKEGTSAFLEKRKPQFTGQ